jgi:hypothetical protein
MTKRTGIKCSDKLSFTELAGYNFVSDREV